jgi:tetratricopeptide (TPR) repeat protein
VPTESIRSENLREALEALVKVYEEKNWLDRILMASLVLNVKGPSHAERLISLAINEKDLPSNLRAMAYEAQGTSLVYRNRFGDAVRSFERAVRYAHKSRDIYQLCEAQISLIGAKVDCFGPAAIGTLVAEALKSAQSTGDPHMLALLHYRVAVVEGRRGATDVAKRHLDLGLELLQRTPNPWVECCARLAACSIAYVSSDLTGALEQSECALRLARFCGAAFYESASLCNSAQICVALGLLERASDHLKSAEPSIGEFPFLRFCLYDTQAQLQLASGNLSDCEETLNALSRQIAQTTEDNQSFPQLDSLVSYLMRQQKSLSEP